MEISFFMRGVGKNFRILKNIYNTKYTLKTMEKRDSSVIKEKILEFLRDNGPSLPVHIARNVEMDMIFTSAFLSELISNQKVKTSYMKVGTSPIYYLPGQEGRLEKFSEYVKGKEKEAYEILKKKEFILDSEADPAIKVALRSIKDFAKPFENKGNLVWRYFLIEQNKYDSPKEENKKEEVNEKTKEYPEKETPKEIKPVKKKVKEIKKSKTKKSTKEKDEKFFNKVKEYLEKKGLEISDIISFNKKDLVLKVIQGGKEKLLFAYNKKRITEKDILNAYKKSEERNLNYILFSLGEPLKKTQNLIKAAKKLDSIEKID